MITHWVEASISLAPVRVKCTQQDTIGDVKRKIASRTASDWKKIHLKKWSVLPTVSHLPVLKQVKGDDIQGQSKIGRL